MAALSAASALLDQLKAAFAGGESKLDHALSTLDALKLKLLELPATPAAAAAAAPSPTGSASGLPAGTRDALLVAREALELGALLAVRAADTPAFERHVSQLKSYYTDCGALLPASERQWPILGLNLLRLLAQNRIAEFHTELELVPPELMHTNVYIKFPAQLEQHIMEGSYNRVLVAKNESVYEQEGMYFMDMLVDTVREEIAECSEKAYVSIGASELQSLLMLADETELAQYAEQRGWRVSGGVVTFGDGEPKLLALPATQLIAETLAYAKELERIV
uniref:CSN8/PSMD8/EIF3K domain-containing protein n=1 Tax=Chrysotila carterae TaxID=13221 RepID=A0A6S9RU20_CHRCT